MNYTIYKLREGLPKSILAIMPQEDEKKAFENNLSNYLLQLQSKQTESEEFQKGLLKDLLVNLFPNNFINTSGRTDLVIYNGQHASSTPFVLFEMKSLSNKLEMMTVENLNTKAFQEIVAYFLHERIANNNLEIKKLIVTNGLNWFVFEARQFERYFYKEKKLVDLWNKWYRGQLTDHTTDFLYKNIIAPSINKALENGLSMMHFNMKDFIIDSKGMKFDERVITPLYRFFTLENLMNKKIFADSNKLNKSFYDELLYIMGLHEVTSNSGKVIQRLPESERQLGTFVENAIDRLEMHNVSKELQENTAIQLSVVWINRILFLKLLESQLISFNKDISYKFLTYEKIKSFRDMYDLFFDVMAKRPENRRDDSQAKFGHVPYLNSSLFEPSELELSQNGVGIDNLREEKISIYRNTVLRNMHGKKMVGKISYIEYIFEFLGAYDFSTSIKHNIDSKNDLINASVLGLIFEKINGYADGSFYTPGRITMYMSRKAIRKTLLDKVNAAKGTNYSTIEDLRFNITTVDAASEINQFIDSLKICDPAVGSGHFLVSILNEIIALKSELRCLFDTTGKVMTDIHCAVVNDELVVQDINGDNFSYIANNQISERIQKSIFEQKQSIIENSLFGVDINPNSANICRLRLWIELLKNSYYQINPNTNTRELITLPNIDINIKVGNSLLHKFDMNTSFDMRKTDFKDYMSLVSDYKNSYNKSSKAAINKKIQEMKEKFRESAFSPEKKKVMAAYSKLTNAGQLSLLSTQEELDQQQIKLNRLSEEFKKAEKEMEIANKNPLFAHGLEWRMEFPEILNKEGQFDGFDLIIANPPYIYSANDFFSYEEKQYFLTAYPLNKYQANTFGLFLELSFHLLKPNGYVSMIIPNTFLSGNQYADMRNYLLENCGDLFLLNSLDKIFEDASVDNCIINAKKSKATTVQLAEMERGEVSIIANVDPKTLISMPVISIATFKGGTQQFTATILNSIEKAGKPLEPTYAIVRDGLKVYQKGKGRPKQTSDDDEFKLLKEKREWFTSEKINEDWWEIIKGENINRFSLTTGNEFINWGEYLAEPRTTTMFTGERLLIRQIPKKNEYTITVAYTDSPIMHERSVISIRDLKIPSLFLLGCLNSKVMSFYALHKYGFLQRKTFPQWRLGQIKSLPIPYANDKQVEELSRLVDDVLKTDGLIRKTREIEIDEFVMNLMGLSQVEKNFITSFTL